MNTRAMKRCGIFATFAWLACIAEGAEKLVLDEGGVINRIDFRQRCDAQPCEQIPVVSEQLRTVDVSKKILYSTSGPVIWSGAELAGDRVVRLRISDEDTSRLNESLKDKLPLHMVVVADGIALSAVIVVGDVSGKIDIGQIDGALDQGSLTKYLKSIERGKAK